MATLKRLSAIVLVMFFGCAGPTREPSKSPPIVVPEKAAAPPSININGLEQQVIRATNSFRGQNNLATLKPSPQLMALAQRHARNMARQDKFGDSDKNGHILDGQNFEDRIRASGYPFARAAENVGYELNKPEPAAAMMDGWKNSPGHRRNMLTSEITELGVGAAQGRSGRWYFVQVFGVQQRRDKP